MNIYDRYVRQKVEFRVPNLSLKQKNVLWFIAKKIVESYDRYDTTRFNQFERLKLIIWTRNRTDYQCENAIGCCDWENVYSLYYDDSRFDSFIMSMELAHFAMQQICSTSSDKITRDRAYLYANDLIHRAANGMEPQYVKQYTIKYKEPSLWQAFKERLKVDKKAKFKPLNVTVFIYNLTNLYNDRHKLMAEIAQGKGPKGVNPYWEKVENSSAKDEVLRWLNHYHVEDEIDHHNHQH